MDDTPSKNEIDQPSFDNDNRDEATEKEDVDKHLDGDDGDQQLDRSSGDAKDWKLDDPSDSDAKILSDDGESGGNSPTFPMEMSASTSVVPMSSIPEAPETSRLSPTHDPLLAEQTTETDNFQETKDGDVTTDSIPDGPGTPLVDEIGTPVQDEKTEDENDEHEHEDGNEDEAEETLSPEPSVPAPRRGGRKRGRKRAR